MDNVLARGAVNMPGSEPGKFRESFCVTLYLIISTLASGSGRSKGADPAFHLLAIG